MTTIIQADMEVPDPEMYSQRAVRRATKAGYLEMALYWVAKELPKRFRPGNILFFKFADRSEKYVKEKMRLARLNPHKYPFEGKVPAVRTGKSGKSMQEGAQVRAYPTRATIKLPGAAWLRKMFTRPGAPDITAEVLQVPYAERRVLARILMKTVIQNLESRRGKYVYKPKGASGAGE